MPDSKTEAVSSASPTEAESIQARLDTIEEAIEDAGGIVKSGVSKKLSYLVASDPTSNWSREANAIRKSRMRKEM